MSNASEVFGVRTRYARATCNGSEKAEAKGQESDDDS